MDNFVQKNKAFFIPLVAAVVAFILGSATENRIDMLPDEGRPEVVVECAEEVDDDIPVIHEVTVYSQHFAEL